MTAKITTSPPSFPPEVEPHRPVKTPSPQGLSGIPDRIAPSPQEKNATLSILQINREYEDVIRNFIGSQGSEIFNDQKDVFQLKKEQLETLRRKTEKLQQADNWSAVSDMAFYFTNASTLALAIGQIGTGGVAGPVLLAAGGLGLSTRLIDLLGGWDCLASYFREGKENQQELADLLKTVANYVSLGAFLISSGYTYTHSNLDQLSLHSQKVLATASTLFAGATHTLSNIYKYLANSAESLFQTLKDNETQAYAQTILLSSNITSTTEEKEAVHKKMQAIVLTQTPI